MDERIGRLGKLSTALLADGLDHVGLRHQFLDAGIRPIANEMKFAGRARTAISTIDTAIDPSSYDEEFAAVDSVEPGDVIVASAPPDVSFAFWGELLATAARRRGGVGVVVDGMVRDARALVNMGFPTFSLGFCPADCKGRGRVTARDVPIVCGGVRVHPGDFIAGDLDGLVVIPRSAVDDVLAFAEEKRSGESDVRRALADGRTVRETYDRYKIM